MTFRNEKKRDDHCHLRQQGIAHATGPALVASEPRLEPMHKNGAAPSRPCRLSEGARNRSFKKQVIEAGSDSGSHADRRR